MRAKGDSLANVLLVEDSEADAAIISRSLERANIGRAEIARTGREAMQRLESADFDAVLLDHRLPDMTGLDVLRQLQERAIDAPVIVITDAGNKLVAVEAMKLGASDYLLKDEIMTTALPRAVKAVLERRRAEREREAREAEERRRRELEEALQGQQQLVERLELQIANRQRSAQRPAMTPGEWEQLSTSYQRLTRAFLANPQVPPIRELDDFVTDATQAMLSPHQLMALHYAALSQLLAAGEESGPQQASEARLALVSVLLRLMDEYRQTMAQARGSKDGAP